jgi:hypothetical protein
MLLIFMLLLRFKDTKDKKENTYKKQIHFRPIYIPKAKKGV